jgi:hypothetical protein
MHTYSVTRLFRSKPRDFAAGLLITELIVYPIEDDWSMLGVMGHGFSTIHRIKDIVSTPHQGLGVAWFTAWLKDV